MIITQYPCSFTEIFLSKIDLIGQGIKIKILPGCTEED